MLYRFQQEIEFLESQTLILFLNLYHLFIKIAKMTSIIMLLLLIALAHSAILSTANIISYGRQSEYSVSSNAMGLSMDLPDILPFFNSSLLHKYLLNSNFYGQWGGNFQQIIHTPLGYFYNCSFYESHVQALYSNPPNISCTADLANQTLIKIIGSYIYQTTNRYAFGIGWNVQHSDFFNYNYLQNFISFVKSFAKAASDQPYYVELLDYGNLLQSQYGINYTMDNFLNDCNTINSYFYGLYLYGPGATQSADSSWYSSNQKIYQNCGAFTYRAVAFENVSTLTIDNLLSEDYTTAFWIRRFTINGTNYIGDFNDYVGSINDFRMVEDPAGVDGLTNSFAAAIWAIEASMEFFFIGGYTLNFYNPMLNHSYQSVLGQAPLFQPSSLYYALLFTSIALLNSPYILKVVINPGLSSKIQVYGLDYFQSQGVLILNKETNSSISGQVSVKIGDNTGLNCFYLTAQSLTSTSGFKIGGLYFKPNSTEIFGNFTMYQVFAGQGGFYNIPLNYSQVVYCYTNVQTDYQNFPVGSNLNGPHYCYILILTLLALFVL